ncbi:MAG: UbiX family flavin prenyltransferase [Desulfovibrio sp.]|jgi:4-hydroxy-3-polyprenylbenzoate decarboxylase|nr:UbiX family flavin prenyltransferase [Desulfovibrio sp.]
MKILVGISGASGGIYAVELLRELVRQGRETEAVFTPWGEKVMRHECGLGPEDFPGVTFHAPDNMFAGPASGSNAFDHMVIVPCSMHTLACAAHGLSGNLAQRCAGVMLKERRNLILVPRETPLSAIHLENMLILAKAGAVILPAAPAFYHNPQSMGDLVRHVVGKILEAMCLTQTLFPAWREPVRT